MHFTNLIKKEYQDKEITIYVDMDGVIAEYLVGNLDFLNKRPLTNNIKVFEELSKEPNISLHILSIGKKVSDIKDKNTWLNINASFFKEENRHILTKDVYKDLTSKEIKCEFIRKAKDNIAILVDDDNSVLKYIKKELPEVILYQDSSLVD